MMIVVAINQKGGTNIWKENQAKGEAGGEERRGELKTGDLLGNRVTKRVEIWCASGLRSVLEESQKKRGERKRFGGM